MPLNSLTIVIQLSRSKTEIYFGCYFNALNITQDEKFIVKKRDLLKSEFKELLKIKKSINKVKKNMIKTPFESSAKIQEIIAENEEILSIMNKKFLELNKWWLY